LLNSEIWSNAGKLVQPIRAASSPAARRSDQTGLPNGALAGCQGGTVPDHKRAQSLARPAVCHHGAQHDARGASWITIGKAFDLQTFSRAGSGCTVP